MNIYLVRRDGQDVDWDEYDSVVVLAKNKENALEHAIKFQSYFSEERVTVEEVKQDKEGIIHDSFCAG